MLQRLPITDPIIIGPSVCCMWTVDDILVRLTADW